MVVEQQPDGIALFEHQIREGGGQRGRVAELAQRRPGLKIHRARDVEQDIGFEVRLFFVLLDVEAVGFGVGLPVDIAQRVARYIGAVLGELDGEAVVRASVQAGDKPLDDQARDEIQARDPRDGLGIEVSGVLAQISFAARCR